MTAALILVGAAAAKAATDDPQSEGDGSSSTAPRQPTRSVRRHKLESRTKSHDAGVITAPDASSERADAGVAPAGDSKVDAGAGSLGLTAADAGVASTPASAAPSSTAPVAALGGAGVEVRIRDTVVLTLRLSDGGMSAAERARRANRAIERALGVSSAKTVRVEQREGRSIVFIAEQPVVELTADDAAVAGEGSLELYSASVAARVSDMLRAEEQRTQWTHTVVSIVSAIIAAVVAIFFIKKIGDWTGRLRNWAERNPQRIPAIRFKTIEVVRSPVLQGALLVSLAVAQWLAYFATGYACLIFVLSRFDATRGYTIGLASWILSPLSILTARVATLLPLTVIVAIGAIGLLILLRFIGLFFASVERGEIRLDHISPTLAAPTSLIVRVGLVVLTLLLIAPALTGNANGTFAMLGQLAVAALLLACAPLLTTVLLGMRVLYTRRLAVGQWVSVGNVTGRILELTLFETRIWVSASVTARVPHLLLLWQPVRTAAGNLHRLVLTLVNNPKLAAAIDATSSIIAGFGPDASVTVESMSSTRATLVVQVTMPESKDKNALLFEVVRILAENGVSLADT